MATGEVATPFLFVLFRTVFCLLFGAIITDSRKFNMMPENLVVTCCSGQGIDMFLYRDLNVIYLAALDAPDMIMRVDGGIKTFLGAANLEFKDQAAFRHEFKISIDSSQPDTWQSLANHVVNLIGSRVRGYFCQLFQNDLTLGS